MHCLIHTWNPFPALGFTLLRRCRGGLGLGWGLRDHVVRTGSDGNQGRSVSLGRLRVLWDAVEVALANGSRMRHRRGGVKAVVAVSDGLVI